MRRYPRGVQLDLCVCFLSPLQSIRAHSTSVWRKCIVAWPVFSKHECESNFGPSSEMNIIVRCGRTVGNICTFAQVSRGQPSLCFSLCFCFVALRDYPRGSLALSLRLFLELIAKHPRTQHISLAKMHRRSHNPFHANLFAHSLFIFFYDPLAQGVGGSIQSVSALYFHSCAL